MGISLVTALLIDTDGPLIGTDVVVSTWMSISLGPAVSINFDGQLIGTDVVVSDGNYIDEQLFVAGIVD